MSTSFEAFLSVAGGTLPPSDAGCDAGPPCGAEGWVVAWAAASPQAKTRTSDAHQERTPGIEVGIREPSSSRTRRTAMSTSGDTRAAGSSIIAAVTGTGRNVAEAQSG